MQHIYNLIMQRIITADHLLQ